MDYSQLRGPYTSLTNHEKSVPSRLLLLSGGVFGACFLLPCSWHFDSMLQEHQHHSMLTSLMPFSLGSSACSHCTLWWPEHPQSVFSCGHLPLHVLQGQGFGQAELVFLQSLQGPCPEGQLGGCSQLWNGDHLSPGLAAPLLCQHKQAKSLVKRISPHCRTSKSSC